MSKVIRTTWFSAPHGNVIGIIKVRDEITQIDRVYIGSGEGVDKEADVKRIKDYGSLFPLKAEKEL